MTATTKLKHILQEIKSTFVGKDEIIDLLGIGLIARENAFLLGPPGTAKSAIVRALAERVENGNNFEYLLTRFTEPNELYGPFDIRKLKEGEMITNTEGMLPEASMVFLDEIFNANSAILNSLLMALNEKIFRRGKQTIKLPALMFVGASNLLPEDEALAALLDRFLIRVRCDYVDPDLLSHVLVAGRKLEQQTTGEATTITPEIIKELQQQAKQIDLSAIQKAYVDLIHNLRSAGIDISDRRAVKLQNLIAASALICERSEAILSDLWVMKYIWDTEEQIEILEGIVNNVIDKQPTNNDHPQATKNKVPDPEELIKDVRLLMEQFEQDPSFEEQNAIKDKLRFLQSRSAWITNPEKKQFIQNEIDAVWKKILQAV